MQKEKLKILILIKPFWKSYIKYQVFYEIIKEFEEYGEIYYWYEDGDIVNILKKIKVKPDFIFHYDMYDGYMLSPKIEGLEKINIPKGCYVIDAHYNFDKRREYINKNKVDLIFSVTKDYFLTKFPEFKDKFRWLPWSINPERFKDWNEEKNIKFLLMGLLESSTHKEPYHFRKAVLEKMKDIDGFVHHTPITHHLPWSVEKDENIYLLDKFAKELNRSEIFFTCGGFPKYPVLKFFEGPACRTLLLAEPNKDILELGFKDGENFIACNQSNFYEKAMYYSNNKIERERITNNGYQFIHTQHTNKIRAKQFINYINEYINERK